jgi:hypothetical protein
VKNIDIIEEDECELSIELIDASEVDIPVAAALLMVDDAGICIVSMAPVPYIILKWVYLFVDCGLEIVRCFLHKDETTTFCARPKNKNSSLKSTTEEENGKTG